MTLNRPLGLSLVAAALLAVYGCGKEEPKPVAPAAAPAMPEMTVKIGHVGPTTGPQAHLGKDNENGARLAIEDANAKGVVIDGKKVKFDLVAEDDQADPKQGTTVAQKLVDAKVAGVVGHLNSGTTIPASKVYHDCGIPHVTGAAPDRRQPGPQVEHRIRAADQRGAAAPVQAGQLRERRHRGRAGRHRDQVAAQPAQRLQVPRRSVAEDPGVGAPPGQTVQRDLLGHLRPGVRCAVEQPLDGTAFPIAEKPGGQRQHGTQPARSRP